MIYMKKIAAFLLALTLAVPLCVSAEAGTVTVSVYSYLDESYIIEPAGLEIADGMTAFSALRKLDLEIKHSNGYVTSINGLAEKANGRYSGWVYTVNGVKPQTTAARYKLKAGDILEWRYAVTAEQAGLTAGDASEEVSSELAVSEEPVSSPPASFVQSESSSAYEEASPPPPEGGIVRIVPKGSGGESSDTESVSGDDTPSENPAESQVSDKSKSEDANRMFSAAVKYIKKNSGDWSALVLSLAGENIPSGMSERQDDGRITDIERRLIVGTAAGSLTENEAIRLAEEIASYDGFAGEGLNAVIFAVIALDAAGMKESLNEFADILISKQFSDGSFALYEDLDSDVDITAMAVCALLLCDGETAAESVDRSVGWLKAHINDDGTVGVSANCESTAQALIALSLAGEDEALLDRLLTGLAGFFTQDGGFCHLADGEADVMPTEQAAMALYAYVNRRSPYSVEIKPATAAQNNTWVIWLAGAAAVLAAGGTALALNLRKRKADDE